MEMKLTGNEVLDYWVSAPGIVLDPRQLDGPHTLDTAQMVQNLYRYLEWLN